VVRVVSELARPAAFVQHHRRYCLYCGRALLSARSSYHPECADQIKRRSDDERRELRRRIPKNARWVDGRLVVVDAFAEKRVCRVCRQGFVARHVSAIYCGIDCWLGVQRRSTFHGR
jgi:hypothetical protein